MQIPYLPVRGTKLPCFMGVSKRTRMEICGISGLPVPMVSRLHQRNVYIKRKLRAWRFQKVLPLWVQIPYLAVRGRKLPRFMGSSIRSRLEICENSALPIPMVPHLHQSNGYIKRKLRALRVQKCIALVGADTILSSAGPQTTRFHGG